MTHRGKHGLTLVLLLTAFFLSAKASELEPYAGWSWLECFVPIYTAVGLAACFIVALLVAAAIQQRGSSK